MNVMTQPIISIESLSKRYFVGHETSQRSRYTALRDVLAREARNFARKAVDVVRGRQVIQGDEVEEFWALRNVSFDVTQGEVIGIIGRNGAGKSTLLKILSRITEPTEGRVTLRGRVASLLEVGTGFHPELTGRENIFLNGAILGMTRREIHRRFDEIVAFAEVEQFLDTPVKHYSSGMYVRLAFAVAAHLDPEILIVDEVLAVGDVDFQRKCGMAMERIASSERTVILVSHNLALIESLCRRCVLLEQGRLICNDRTEAVIKRYLRRNESISLNSNNLMPTGARAQLPHFTSINTIGPKGEPASVFGMGEDIFLKLGVNAPQVVRTPWIGIEIRTENRELVAHIANREAGYDLPSIDGQVEITCHLKHPNLQGGIYYIDLIFADARNHIYHQVEAACRLEIRAVDVFRTGMPMSGAYYGVCFFPSAWEVRATEAASE
jgi:homopolymeric O-antigen transport system ATP-binding protein